MRRRMRVTAVPMVAVLAHLPVLSDEVAAGPVAPIIGGDSSEPGEFAATGAVVLGHRYHCTATLIAPDVIVTAAHCFETDGWTGLGFTLDTDLTDSVDGVISISKYHKHPEFVAVGEDSDKVGRRNDIAVAILDEPILDVDVELMDTRPYVEEDVETSLPLALCGYGRESWALARTGGVKRDGTVRMHLSNDWELQSTEEDPQPCKGDSGGPLFSDTEDGRLITAVVSRASGSSLMCDSGAIYTRVAPYVDWIEQAATYRDEGGCAAGGSGQGMWPALLGWALLLVRRRRRR